MNGARAKVKPIPERPIAYAVANLFRKYRAVTTEKDWYSNANPIPERRKEGYHLPHCLRYSDMSRQEKDSKYIGLHNYRFAFIFLIL